MKVVSLMLPVVTEKNGQLKMAKLLNSIGPEWLETHKIDRDSVGGFSMLIVKWILMTVIQFSSKSKG